MTDSAPSNDGVNIPPRSDVLAENVWFPDDQHGYSIALCECEGGPYLGARQMGTPCVCETCGRITSDQWDFLVSRVKADALQEAADYVTTKNWTGPNGTLLHLNHWLNTEADRLRNPITTSVPTASERPGNGDA